MPQVRGSAVRGVIYNAHLQRTDSLRAVTSNHLLQTAGIDMNHSDTASPAMIDAQTGKLGIALSGGGFRAALFHIGVLARLAQQDMLRHVALISTVSGGSIIGAAYYLKVKQLLEGRRADGLQPSAAGFRKLVQELESEFLVAMQVNLRMMTFADQRENVRMLASKTSPTHRVGDLFNSHFFLPITGKAENLLRDLPIQSEALARSPADHGGAQQVAVPKLIINTTALNTGHLFQFTGAYIGEPSVSSVTGGTATMPQLKRLYMDDPELTQKQRARLGRISLGEAVAASCCVPGLLDPLPLEELYQDAAGRDVVVRLVDGGVFDNQGLVSLFEEGCTHFICSDASDLLRWQSSPADVIHAVAMRANDIMMDRIRIEVMQELQQRNGGNFAVFTLGAADGSEIFGEDAPRFLQSLQSIRTDLDAFSDIEAWSLMYHGYAVSKRHLYAGDAIGSGEVEQVELDSQWNFTAIKQLAENVRERERLLRHLEVGSRQFLKVFYLGKPLPWLIAIVPTLIPISFSILLIYFLPPIPTSAWVVLGLMLISLVAYTQNARIIAWLDQVESFKRARQKLAIALRPIGITMLLGMTGALVSQINLRVFNTLFLRYGRLDNRRG